MTDCRKELEYYVMTVTQASFNSNDDVTNFCFTGGENIDKTAGRGLDTSYIVIKIFREEIYYYYCYYYFFF